MSKKVVLFAVAALLAAYLWDVTRPYVPKHKANECFVVVIPPQEDGQNPMPIAVLIDSVNEEQEYVGTLLVGFVMPSPLKAPAREFDKELEALNAEQVDCETGEAIQK